MKILNLELALLLKYRIINLMGMTHVGKIFQANYYYLYVKDLLIKGGHHILFSSSKGTKDFYLLSFLLFWFSETQYMYHFV